MLVLCFYTYFYLCNFNYRFFFFVCEGSLCLSILVSMIHSHGNDYFESYSVFNVKVPLFF